MDENSAREFALQIIREEIGTIPFGGDPYLDGEKIWTVPILVNYPKVHFDNVKKAPKRLRFLHFGRVGEIRIDRMTGDRIERTHFYDIEREIKKRLGLVRTTVDKALVKVSAERLSKLSFPEFRHTPIIDLMSRVLMAGHINIDEDVMTLPEDARDKYFANIDLLNSIDLLARSDGPNILPGNILIEIEGKYPQMHQQVSAALAYLFSKAYDRLESIRTVLGAYLTIGGRIYADSIEYGEITPFDLQMLETVIEKEYYDVSEKKFKLPRYLIQLESVGIIQHHSRGTILEAGRADIPRYF
jgi:hypothetical protein